MKLQSLLICGVVFATLPLAGCASNPHGLVLAPVGPPASGPTPGSEGSLLVFSAYDQTAHFNRLPYRMVHTDYKILADDGTLLQAVHNDNGTSVEGPIKVFLPVGRYRVVARANGYGEVTVPVIIAANQTTTVHLEGGTGGLTQAPSEQTSVVRLPNGEIVGSRAAVQPTTAPTRYHHEIVSEFSDGETKFLRLVPDDDSP